MGLFAVVDGIVKNASAARAATGRDRAASGPATAAPKANPVIFRLAPVVKIWPRRRWGPPGDGWRVADQRGCPRGAPSSAGTGGQHPRGGQRQRDERRGDHPLASSPRPRRQRALGRVASRFVVHVSDRPPLGPSAPARRNVRVTQLPERFHHPGQRPGTPQLLPSLRDPRTSRGPSALPLRRPAAAWRLTETDCREMAQGSRRTSSAGSRQPAPSAGVADTRSPGQWRS